MYIITFFTTMIYAYTQALSHEWIKMTARSGLRMAKYPYFEKGVKYLCKTCNPKSGQRGLDEEDDPWLPPVSTMATMVVGPVRRCP